MPELRVQVDHDVADALAVERDLLGFESEEAYLAWIVENRAAIEQGTEAAELLAAYRGRLAALEARLEAEGVDPRDVDGDAIRAGDAGAADPTDEGTAARAAVGTDERVAGGADEDAAAAAERSGAAVDGADASAGGGPSGPAETSVADSSSSVSDSTSTASDSTSSVAEEVAVEWGGAAPTPHVPGEDDREADGDGADAGSAEPADGAEAASDGGESVAGAEVTSMHLAPERVQRINEDPVARDAGELSDVETRRVDELSRRAVARTREQLDRDVETGLSYSSSATIDESDVRPGEDLADLDAIDVPGRSEELVEQRRAVVGRALAFLRDEGRARRSEFVEEFYDDHPAGYETADGWWRCVREGLGQVDAVDGGHVWEYVG